MNTTRLLIAIAVFAVSLGCVGPGTTNPGDGGSMSHASSTSGSSDTPGGSGGVAGAMVTGCQPGKKLCGGVCVNEDASNGCGSDNCEPCAVPNAIAHCTQDGSCAVAVCHDGWEDCNNSGFDGCETDVDSDSAHCGACGNNCSDMPNTTAECIAGKCANSCVPGWGDCYGGPNGCETDVYTSESSCGTCGHACQPAEACESGVCTSCDYFVNDTIQNAPGAYGKYVYTAFEYVPQHNVFVNGIDVAGIGPSKSGCDYQNINIRIFDDAGGKPGNGVSLGASCEYAVFDTNGWYRLVCSSPFAMSAGTRYWIVTTSYLGITECLKLASGGQLVTYWQTANISAPNWTTGGLIPDQGGKTYAKFRMHAATCF